MKGYASIGTPLNAMLKKGEFRWTERARESFESLKQALLSLPVLRMPNFEEVFVLECDALGVGLGAVLMQNDLPIAYSSYGLKGKALLLSAFKKEMLAIMFAVAKWKQYLMGRQFIIKTDQWSIKFLFDQRFR